MDPEIEEAEAMLHDILGVLTQVLGKEGQHARTRVENIFHMIFTLMDPTRTIIAAVPGNLAPNPSFPPSFTRT